MLFRHIVLFSFNETVTEYDRRSVKERLSRLPASIPEVYAFSCGLNAGTNPNNFDMILVADFLDESRYARYADHPAHRQFITEVLDPVIRQRASIQFWIDTEHAGASHRGG